jgi:ABC-type nitrate/sulfonate/bicarbonate transport system substrate-binding protein
LKEIDEGQIRLIAKATDAATVRGQTIRTIVASLDTLTKRQDVVARFMQAYRETIDYMYSHDPRVLKDYAEFARIPEAMARRVRDEFFPKALLQTDEIKGLDSLMAEAITLKFIDKPLSQQQLSELIQIPAPAKR